MRAYNYKIPFNKSQHILVNAVVIAMVAGISVTKFTKDYTLQDIPNQLPVFAIPIVLIAFTLFITFRNIRKYSNLTVTINIDEHSVAANAPGLFAHHITRDEVINILELANGNLMVSKSNTYNINIPKYMEGYAEVRAILKTWKQFTPTKTLSQAISFYQIFPGVVFAIGLIGSGVSANEQIASFFAFLCLAGGAHSFYLLNKIKRDLPQVARLRWFILFFMIVIAGKALTPFMMS